MESYLYKIKNKTKEPEELFKIRKKAYDKFISFPTPSPKDEDWKYTTIQNLNVEYKNVSVQEQKYLISNKTEGIIFTDIREALLKYPERIIPLLKKIMSKNQDKIVAMNNSLWENGFFIYVPKGIQARLLLKKESKNNIKSKKQVFELSHNLIVIEENASLVFFEEENKEAEKIFKNNAYNIFLEKNSFLDFYVSLSEKEQNNSISNLNIIQEKDSVLNLVFSQKSGALNRVKIETNICGEGASASVSGFFKGEKEEQFDITTNIYHKAKATKGDILIKGALDKKSTSIFRGKIKIEKEGQETNSFLADHVLLLGEESFSNSIPSLEIDADDVKASHGATTGRPDDEEVFYLMSRGYNRQDAEKLIISGFFEDILLKIKDKEIKEKFELLLE